VENEERRRGRVAVQEDKLLVEWQDYLGGVLHIYAVEFLGERNGRAPYEGGDIHAAGQAGVVPAQDADQPRNGDE